MSYNHIPIRKAKIQNINIPTADENVEQWELSFFGSGMKMVQPLGKDLAVYYKLNTGLRYDPNIP